MSKKILKVASFASLSIFLPITILFVAMPAVLIGTIIAVAS